MQLDIVSDAICPWCYIGKRQLERALPVPADEGLTFTIRWNPFQLNPEMPKQACRVQPIAPPSLAAWSARQSSSGASRKRRQAWGSSSIWTGSNARPTPWTRTG
ncbi:MAG: DsbA family protein [Acetobacteraceae bacterium]|nr:DsbA family protein [Acetobacteraceae bacterium]